ncbi:hypothetical protein [Streptomyces sp. NRRL S-87]|uniref:hypothetical protein n=1 Tax=Streptomyces sp. NRRL S-87 TaxID=1463920 RepID=UPI000562DAC9|nr:hypothetical protein [Streptomyces sp. NRRL S-87]
MATRRKLTSGGTLVLDSEGLSQYLARHRPVVNRVDYARRREANVVVSGVTLVEAYHAGVKRAHWEFVLSQLDIKPMTVEWFREAADLLSATGLHGHKYAIDAMVAVTTLHQPGPLLMLTSDVDGMARLCGDRVTLVGV